MKDGQSYAFVDETGNPNMDTTIKSVGTHYVVTAITVEKAKLRQVLKHVRTVRGKYFQTGEMRSSTVAGDDERRKEILENLLDTPLVFGICSLPVDKQKLYSEGYPYPPVFIKNLQGKLYSVLLSRFSSILIYAHRQRDSRFMREFRDYIFREHCHPSHDLFGTTDVRFVGSKRRPLVQAADFIGGTIARCFDKSFGCTVVPELMRILSRRSPYIDPWPPGSKPWHMDVQDETPHSDFDQLIERTALTSAYDFLERKKDSGDMQTQDQIRCLRYLLNINHYFSRQAYVSAPELEEALNYDRAETVSGDDIRHRIVPSLRDEGVVICSSNKGYKLPVSEADLYRYCDFANSVLVGWCKRIQQYRETLRIASHGSFDILEQKPQYTNLLAAIKAGMPADKAQFEPESDETG